jgi:hypothetical protein
MQEFFSGGRGADLTDDLLCMCVYNVYMYMYIVCDAATRILVNNYFLAVQ